MTKNNEKLSKTKVTLDCLDYAVLIDENQQKKTEDSERCRDDAIRHSDASFIVQHDKQYQKDLSSKHVTANLVNAVQEQRFQEMIERGETPQCTTDDERESVSEDNDDDDDEVAENKLKDENVHVRSVVQTEIQSKVDLDNTKTNDLTANLDNEPVDEAQEHQKQFLVVNSQKTEYQNDLAIPIQKLVAFDNVHRKDQAQGIAKNNPVSEQVFGLEQEDALHRLASTTTLITTTEAVSVSHAADSPAVCKTTTEFKPSKSTSSSYADAQHR
ncbi:unnamed protein product [Rotaria socialis]|uniref:Uncharacterized protein n=1 Tax=Rotaria socialis TaxID=392032 RepID=A0A817WVY1_9BILA|nr:unnamed protein product [Rotaria socialis]CAF3359929.1 unnamed protein product [Rotaria socialis]CAF4288995.1 unnamed protein product [Rotaria socialis]CAF4430496.1 unnamed protein product [Rotaria socialis]